MSFGRLKSPARSPRSSLSRTSSIKPSVQQLDRLVVLERAVAKLRQQQDALAAAATLSERVQTLIDTEAEVRKLHQRTVTLESEVNSQVQVMEEFESPEPEIALEQETRSLRRMVSALEALQPAGQIRHMLDLKVRPTQGCEVTLKTEVLTLLHSADSALHQVKSEFTQLASELTSLEGISAAQAAVSSLQTRMTNSHAHVTEYLTTQELLSDESVRTELGALVDQAAGALSRHLQLHLTQLDVLSQQESLALKGLVDSVTLWNATAPWASELTTAVSVLQRLGSEHLTGVEEAAEAVHVLITETQEALTAHIAALPLPEERLEEQTNYFDDVLNSAVFQLEILREKTKEIQRRIAVEVTRVKRITPPDDSSVGDLQSELTSRLTAAKTRQKSLAGELLEMWERVEQEGDLDVPLPDNRDLWREDGR